MKMTYWIAEHSEAGPNHTLRFNTKEEFEAHTSQAGVRDYVKQYYDLPREITVESNNILKIIHEVLNRGSHQVLSWEKR